MWVLIQDPGHGEDGIWVDPGSGADSADADELLFIVGLESLT